MEHDLNIKALERLIEYRKTTKVGKRQKVIPMTQRAIAIARNKLKQRPEHIQSQMVKDCIDNNWETVHLKAGTLDFDKPGGEKPSYEKPPRSIQSMIVKAHKPIPKYERTEEQKQRGREAARKILEGLDA